MLENIFLGYIFQPTVLGTMGTRVYNPRYTHSTPCELPLAKSPKATLLAGALWRASGQRKESSPDTGIAGYRSTAVESLDKWQLRS